MSTKRYTLDEIRAIYFSPLFELINKAAKVHSENWTIGEVQVCTLLSIKTGACTEDCGYCSQSARNKTEVEYEGLMEIHDVMEAAHMAREAGSTRFCMGAAWREVKNNDDFDKVLEMVRAVSELGLEVCCTLGMLTDEQAGKLKAAGLTAYNHNLDTSEEKYGEIITTRTYQDRLDTLDRVGKAKISICSGGIIGLGETDEDRVKMLFTLNQLPVQPESVPVNALVPIPGTPLGDNEKVKIWEMLRMIATARIVFPTSKVRLSAGRQEMSEMEQALCFLAGANSIFSGEKLLTTPNPDFSADRQLFELLGLRPQEAQIPVKSYDLEQA